MRVRGIGFGGYAIRRRAEWDMKRRSWGVKHALEKAKSKCREQEYA